MPEKREREKDPSLIYTDSFQTESRRGKITARFFCHSERSEESLDFAETGRKKIRDVSLRST
jgi:hypothetical protein